MLTSIIGYVLTVLFAWFSMIAFREMFKRDSSTEESFAALLVFITMGLFSLGTAWMAGI